MRLETVFSIVGRRHELRDLASPVDLDTLVPGDGPWEVELGFGKGRYLLRRAQEDPDRRFLGIEIVSKYFRLLEGRAARRSLPNLVASRGEALYLLSAALPRAFAEVVHVYFPDPWPKARHQKRRLFDPTTVDLVVGLLAPGGRLLFASDFLEYGEQVVDLLNGYPDLEVERHEAPWPEGPRTNYEAKFMREGRPIVRLTATRARGLTLHPDGCDDVRVAPRLAAERGDGERRGDEPCDSQPSEKPTCTS